MLLRFGFFRVPEFWIHRLAAKILASAAEKNFVRRDFFRIPSLIGDKRSNIDLGIFGYLVERSGEPFFERFIFESLLNGMKQ